MFALVAARRGDHWRLVDDEKDALGNSLANVLRHIPLPERELGIAADIAALGMASYMIVAPRLDAERRALAGAGVPPSTAFRPPVATPTGPTVAESDPDYVERLSHAVAGIDLSTPAGVAALNDLAARTTAPLIAEGSAVDGGRVEVQADELGPHFGNGVNA